MVPLTRIQVFARAPRPGQTKTRLIPALGPEGAARLHERLIHHTLSTARAAARSGIELWCSPDTDHPCFQACAREFGVALRTQQGSDLGERMHHALNDARHQGQHAILVSTDCPALSAQHLRQAARWLESDTDLVLGPATDGGYVLIGAGRAEPALFAAMPWGTDQLLGETLGRARILGLHVRCLDPLPDVDRPEDLEHLRDLQG